MRFFELYEQKLMEDAEYDSLMNPLYKIMGAYPENTKKSLSMIMNDSPDFVNDSIALMKKQFNTRIKEAKAAFANLPGKSRWVMYVAKIHRATQAKYLLNDFENTPAANELKKIIGPFGDRKHSISVIRSLAHYTAYDYEPIKKYDPGNKPFTQVIDELDKLEQEYQERIGEDDRMLKLQEGDEILHNFGNGHVWVKLARGACRQEADAMGHCGNVPSQKSGDRILSFRKIRQRGKETFYEPFMTFIYNEQTKKMGEMKGRANEKPADKYHPYIIWLLKQDFVRGFGPRGYAPEDDFQMDDLTPEQRDDVISANPWITLSYGTPLRKIPESIRSMINMPMKTGEYDVWYDSSKNKIYLNVPVRRVIDKHILEALERPYDYFDPSPDNDSVEYFVRVLNEENLKLLYEKVKEVIESEEMTFETTFEEFVKKCGRRDFFGVFEEYLDEDDEPVDFEDNPLYEDLISNIKNRISTVYMYAYERELAEKIMKNIPDIELEDFTMVAVGTFYDKDQTEMSEQFAGDTKIVVFESDNYFETSDEGSYEDEIYVSIKKLDFDRLQFDSGYVGYTKEEANNVVSDYGFDE